jgi:uncharacterized protein (DUF1499 family)
MFRAPGSFSRSRWLTGAIGIVLPMLFACSTSHARQGSGRPGILPPCPGSPNCVSSQAGDERRRVDPILFTGDGGSAWSRLRRVIEGMKRARITEETDGTLHVEYRSAVFGFVDDVEFLMDAAGSRIEVRSASRTGYYDFGANRRRVEEIRARFAREP